MCLPGIESSSYISISFLLKLTVKLIKLINVIELADCNFKCVCVWKICGESADRNDVSSVVVVVMVVALDLPFLLRLGSCNVCGGVSVGDMESELITGIYKQNKCESSMLIGLHSGKLMWEIDTLR